MASVETAVIAALAADAGFAAMAGPRVALFGVRENEALPHATLQRISTVGAFVLRGPASLQWPRVQIDCWASDAAGALALGEAVRLALDAVAQVGDGFAFTATFQDQRGPAPDEEARVFRVSQDYLVFHERA